MPPDCPLCAFATAPFFTDPRNQQSYFQCPNCDLHFLNPAHHLSPEAELARYKKHENSPDNSGYVDLINRYADWVLDEIKPGALGLDFGSGPSPVFGQILKSRGLSVKTYDPFFSPDASVFSEKFDFIVTVEVVEHLRSPAKDLWRLRQILKPGGRIFIVTSLFHPEISFQDWTYRRDPTHIVFYSRKTFEWVAKTMNFESLQLIEPNRILLTRS